MSSPSRSEAWERVRSLEEIQALLCDVEERRRMIRVQAWNEGSFDVIYDEATKMRDELARLWATLAARWKELMGEARGTDG